MIELGTENIKLHAQAADKTDAIRQGGQLLVDNGYMQPGYIDSMLAREKVANTYLGNGIAIPHGLPKDRELILRTGISVTQIPQGVTWNPGETVYLVVGIAARSDEHIELLSNLTDVLDDEEIVRQLAKTTNPLDIIMQLTRQRSEESILSSMYSDCPYCRGRGTVRSPLSMSVDIQRQLEAVILKQKTTGKGANLEVTVHPSVLDRLRREDEDYLVEVEKRLEGSLRFKSNPSKHMEYFAITDADTEKVLYASMD